VETWPLGDRQLYETDSQPILPNVSQKKIDKQCIKPNSGSASCVYFGIVYMNVRMYLDNFDTKDDCIY
jgi:hypothetical protein